MATQLPSTLPPYKSTSGISYASKNYVLCKMVGKLTIAIHSIVDEQIDYK